MLRYIELADMRWNEFESFQNLGLIPMHGEFSPAGVHYPPITNYSPLSQNEAYENFSEEKNGLFDIYIHIPFCRKQCLFCHYPSRYQSTELEKETYLIALEKEMQLFIKLRNLDKIKARTVLVGGGTPTDLSPRLLKKFLSFFCKYVDISSCQQFNYDVDPSTLVTRNGLERLQIIKDFNGDRLTIGVQSLNDDILKKMNRSHNVKTALDSINNCRKFGFKINIEFIYGHPGETLENWEEVMSQAVKLDVDEIQLYRLKIEPYGDQVGVIKQFSHYSQKEMITVKDTIRMKELASLILAEYGYNENLRRVYTKHKKNISLYAYNQCCRLLDQIGFGISAFSSLHDRFLLNTPSFVDYYNRINCEVLPVNRGLIRSPKQQALWSLILPLKNLFIDKRRFQEINKQNINLLFGEKFNILKKHGLVEETETKISLTSKGSFYADELVHIFYERPYQSFPESDFATKELNPYMLNN